MCHRETQCIKYSCEHPPEPRTESKVDCGSKRCRYSAQHVRPCLGCSATCRQQLGLAQPKITQTSDSKCSHCLRQQGMSV